MCFPQGFFKRHHFKQGQRGWVALLPLSLLKRTSRCEVLFNVGWNVKYRAMFIQIAGFLIFWITQLWNLRATRPMQWRNCSVFAPSNIVATLVRLTFKLNLFTSQTLLSYLWVRSQPVQCRTFHHKSCRRQGSTPHGVLAGGWIWWCIAIWLTELPLGKAVLGYHLGSQYTLQVATQEGGLLPSPLEVQTLWAELYKNRSRKGELWTRFEYRVMKASLCSANWRARPSHIYSCSSGSGKWARE